MIRLAAIATLCTTSLTAQEFVETQGRISDDAFYYLVACSAAPNGPCGEEIVRWSSTDATDLTVAIATPTRGFPKNKRALISASVTRALAEISAAVPDLNMRRIHKRSQADIVVYPQNITDGDRMLPIGRDGVDGQPIGAAHVHVWWNDRQEITDALVVLAADIPDPEIYPVVLEELTQSLGLLTDIKNPYYDTLSVFSEDSNAVSRLGQQDIMALRRHYQN